MAEKGNPARGISPEDAQAELIQMCREDILFYINTFVYTYDPRKTPSIIPWITWEYQDEAITDIQNCIILQEDIFIDKSRDMGASWICLVVIDHFHRFVPMKTFLLVSRNEKLVDKSEDPDSLYWKLDFIEENLPAYLQCSRSRMSLHIYNRNTGSTIDGSSTTQDVSRGGRRTAIMLDEFAAVNQGHGMLSASADAANCRIFNSTPKGTATAHYTVSQWTDIKKLRLHWSRHPEKAQGLYHTAADGTLEVLDKTYTFPKNYPFILDNKMRSPWYDRECKRRSPQEVAEQLDIDYLGASYQFYDPAVLEKAHRDYARPPYMMGDLVFDADFSNISFVPRSEGPLKLWTNLVGEVPPARGDYYIGADISAGTGASNSCLVVADKRLGEKVAEMASPFMRPDALARYAYALGLWFKGKKSMAFLIWEMNGGPGKNFADSVFELGYKRVYYKINEKSALRKVSDRPGWWSTRDEKEALHGEYRRALWNGDFVDRSVESIEEARYYIYMPNMGVVHAQASDAVDPTGAAARHGDRVTASALCWKAMKSKQKTLTVEEKPEAPPGSFLARREAYLKERGRARSVDGWGGEVAYAYDN